MPGLKTKRRGAEYAEKRIVFEPAPRLSAFFAPLRLSGSSFTRSSSVFIRVYPWLKYFPRHPALGTKTAPVGIFRQALPRGGHCPSFVQFRRAGGERGALNKTRACVMARRGSAFYGQFAHHDIDITSSRQSHTYHADLLFCCVHGGLLDL
jgi:hypothetical protein